MKRPFRLELRRTVPPHDWVWYGTYATRERAEEVAREEAPLWWPGAPARIVERGGAVS